jgi:transcription elongation GreA/GreB family factor
MSRAFVKEFEGLQPGDEIPERPQSPLPNHVTPRGLRLLHSQLEALKEERRHLAEIGETDMVAADRLRLIDRDIRYVESRIERALPVDLSAQPQDEVAFGAIVEVVDDQDQPHRFEIVGEDEADVASSRISWASPLAQSLIGAGVGDTVVWRRPAGDVELEIVRISYPGE